MNSKDLIRHSMTSADNITQQYLGDLSDADLMLRPVEGMNHIAWQLGHLISSERHFLELIKPGASPPLPAGFDEAHNKDTAISNDAAKFHKKEEYMSLWKKQRAATLAVLEGLSEADLGKPSPEKFQQFAPTVGAMLNVVGWHPVMHCGQWVAVRRKLKKPVKI